MEVDGSLQNGQAPTWCVIAFFLKLHTTKLWLQQLIQAARKHFPKLRGNVVLQTADLDICCGELVDIPSDSWDELSREISGVTVIQEDTGLGAVTSFFNRCE